MSSRKVIYAHLSPFFHDSVVDYVSDLLDNQSIQFKISKPRKTKLGDYRRMYNSEIGFISINNNLNPVQFIVTTLHEIAHHITHNKFGNKVKPHGIEWKIEYKNLFIPLLVSNHFDSNLKRVFAAHLKNPKATSYSDKYLNDYLKVTFQLSQKRVKDVPLDETFSIGKRKFVKIKKLRTRYLCNDLQNGKKYLIHGHTELSS